MVSLVTPRFTCNARPDGSLRPDDLPPIQEGETVRIAFALHPMLGTDTIASAAWASDPAGLVFANSSVTNSSRNAETDITAPQGAGAYTITASCTLASGALRKPFVRVRICGAEASDYR